MLVGGQDLVDSINMNLQDVEGDSLPYLVECDEFRHMSHLDMRVRLDDSQQVSLQQFIV